MWQSRLAKVKTVASKQTADKPIRKRKQDDTDLVFEVRDPQKAAREISTSLINMREVFFLDRKALFGGMDKAARLFYQQAYRPGFKSKWDEVIEKEARLSIQDRLVKHMKETGYTRAECRAWPELPSGTLTLQEIAEDLKKSTTTTNVR